MSANRINELPSPSELTRLPRQVVTLKTLWPQLLTGSLFGYELFNWLVNGATEARALSILSGGVFALTLAYIISMLRQNKALLVVLPWLGSYSLALLLVLVSPNFLSVAVLTLFTGVSYGLAASKRDQMWWGGVGAVCMIVTVFGLSAAQELGWLNTGIVITPVTTLWVKGLLLFGISLDVTQRLWRHFNRTEAAFSRLQNSNEQLSRIQSELQQRIDERNKLLEVSRVVGSTLDLSTLLKVILEQLREVVEYDGASIMILHGGNVSVLSNTGQMETYGDLVDAPVDQMPQRWQKVLQGQPDVVSDTRSPGYFELALLPPPAISRSKMMAAIGTWLGVPLVVRGKVIGLLAMTHSISGYFTNQHADLAMAFANQVAVAIEGARARDEAIRSAALAERNRLARDLHDSVSQSLFGITLGLRTAMNDTKQSPTALTYSLDLAETALSEMRALIFELRPESLREDGLLVAFRKQASALMVRHKITLKLSLGEREPNITLVAKEALYRIGLEALQNAIRHAMAQQVQLNVACDDQQVTVEVIDDGRGFNIESAFPGHLGLRSMRERAEQMGGRLVVDSAPGRGTRIWVVVRNSPI